MHILNTQFRNYRKKLTQHDGHDDNFSHVIVCRYILGHFYNSNHTVTS